LLASDFRAIEEEEEEEEEDSLDPVGGMCAHSRFRIWMHKYAGRYYSPGLLHEGLPSHGGIS
jgi:hypothetical protein